MGLRQCCVFGVLLFAAAAGAQTRSAQAAAPAEPAVTSKPPEAPSSAYQPLTPGQKFGAFVRRIYSPYGFAGVLFNATYAQAVDQWPTYGQGMEGWGQRIGATYADTQARNFFRVFLLPSVLHQDPRYFRSSKKGFIPRGWYAATRVLVTRKDDGTNGFNSSQVIATMFSSSLANAYYPERDRGFGETMSRAFGSILSDAGGNVLREFGPDIKRIFRRHAPEKVKKIEDKVEGKLPAAKPGDLEPPPTTTPQVEQPKDAQKNPPKEPVNSPPPK